MDIGTNRQTDTCGFRLTSRFKDRNSQTGRCTHRHVDKWKGGQIDTWIYGQKEDTRMDTWTDRHIDTWIYRQTGTRIFEWANTLTER
jgi:hypothetical protein